MKMDVEFIRIALVGAPGSGKSSVKALLAQRAAETRGEPLDTEISFTEEAATVIMADPAMRELRAGDGAAFQEKVAVTQLFGEDAGMYRAVRSGARRHIQITDRALLDAYVYLNDAQRGSLGFPFPSIEQLCERYDAVLFFDMYEMKGGIDEGNALRMEKCNEELRRLHDISLGVYRRHPVFFQIPIFETVEKKANFVAELINGIVGETVFK